MSDFDIDNAFENGLFLTSEEAQEIKELVKEVKAARAEMKKNKNKDGWTKEKILSVKPQSKRQQLIKEHMDLFK